MCRALGLGNSTNACARLDDDEHALISIKGLSRGNDEANAVNESGLYALVLSSRKPEAKAFKRWITHEVIRRSADGRVILSIKPTKLGVTIADPPYIQTRVNTVI